MEFQAQGLKLTFRAKPTCTPRKIKEYDAKKPFEKQLTVSGSKLNVSEYEVKKSSAFQFSLIPIPTEKLLESHLMKTSAIVHSIDYELFHIQNSSVEILSGPKQTRRKICHLL